MKPTLLALLLFTSVALSAQDSTRKWTFKKSIDYWAYWQGYPYFSKVKMPSAVKDPRSRGTLLPISFDTVSDNPLKHGATYVALKTESSYRGKLFLFADIYAEHRGVSYGLFDRKNTVLYPLVRLEARDTVKMGKHKMALDAKAGYFLDEKLGEGLTIYNIDLQGIKVSAARDRWKAQFTLYGDLNSGIGLGIDDLYDLQFTRYFGGTKDHLSASVMLTPANLGGMRNHYTLHLSGRKHWKKASLYFHVAHRPVKGLNLILKKELHKSSAAVLGLEWKKEKGRFTSDLLAEARYYGETFNLFQYEYNFRYRDSASDIYTLHANTVGPYLYPLRKFDTPFSQWAVFTEYQGYDIYGFTLRGIMDFQAFKKFGLYLNYDLNYVAGYTPEPWYLDPDKDRHTSFLYPFFETGISYQPAPFLKASCFATNRTMNLDLSYPTQYLLANPCIGLRLKAHFN